MGEGRTRTIAACGAGDSIKPGAQAPGSKNQKAIEPAERATDDERRCRHLAGSTVFCIEILGLVPQALFFHPLRGFHFSFCGALEFGDHMSLREQCFTKCSEHVQQQIEFSQTLTARTYSAEKELELNPSTTISN